MFWRRCSNKLRTTIESNGNLSLFTSICSNTTKLHDQAVGASFGAGRERLIFDVSKKVKSFVATDLYVYNTAWATAKVEQGMSCRDFVLERAPEGFDSSGLEVKEMDMRSLVFASGSLDFCYSSCAFEHIGHFDDFVAHLKEVKRVLKEGGVYVMTTEHLFCHKTIDVKGNYKFDFATLQAIFEAADFQPNASLDSSLKPSFLNKPKPDLLALDGFNQKMVNFFPSMIISRQGVPYTSSCFVFEKSQNQQSPAQLINHSVQTERFLLGNIRNNIIRVYEQYQTLNPTYNLTKAGRTALADHLEYLANDFDEHVDLAPISVEHFAFTDFIHFDDFNCRVAIQLILKKKNTIRIELVERPQSGLKGRKPIEIITKEVNGSAHFRLNFKAEKNKVYAVAMYNKSNQGLRLINLSIKAKIIRKP